MAWNPTTRREPNIDPFNAPDPIMPTDEPSSGEPNLVDSAERLRAYEAQKRYEQARREAEHHQRHSWHRNRTPMPQQPSPARSQLRLVIAFFVIMMILVTLLPLFLALF